MMIEHGEWEPRRAEQRVAAMWRAIEWGVMERLREDARVQARVGALEDAVRDGVVTPDHAAAELLDGFDRVDS